MREEIKPYVEQVKSELERRRFRYPKDLKRWYVDIIAQKHGFYPYLNAKNVDNLQYEEAVAAWASMLYYRDAMRNGKKNGNDTFLNAGIERVVADKKPDDPNLAAIIAEAKEAGVPEQIIRKARNYMDRKSIIELYAKNHGNHEDIQRFNTLFSKADWKEFGRITSLLRYGRTMPEIDGNTAPAFNTRLAYAESLVDRAVELSARPMK